jgi:ribosomal protein S18 acetylase RimI-like enzyme
MNHSSVIDASRCPAVDVTPLRPLDWPVLKAVRLAALKDSPEAFVADVADETPRTPEQWNAVLTRSTWVVARNDDDEVVGIACLTRDRTPPHEHFVESVWVAPPYRRQNLVRRMLLALEEPARERGAACLQLWVLETNTSAYEAYERLGFEELPDRAQYSEKLRDGKAVKERLMVRELR